MKLSQHQYHEAVGSDAIERHSVPDGYDDSNPNYWMIGEIDQEAQESARKKLVPYMRKLKKLSPDAHETLQLLLSGSTQREIATKLAIAPSSTLIRIRVAKEILAYLVQNPALLESEKNMKKELDLHTKELSTKTVDGPAFLLKYWVTWSQSAASISVGLKAARSASILRPMLKKLEVAAPELWAKFELIEAAHKYNRGVGKK